VSKCCQTTNELYFSYIMARTSYVRWDDNHVRFVLEQHAQLNFDSASSLKQTSAGIPVAPLGHIILILSAAFALSP
jgi:hypothetical protein